MEKAAIFLLLYALAIVAAKIDKLLMDRNNDN